jgi:hypothetical protein
MLEDSYPKLTKEIQLGEQAIKDLAQHLHRMGAESMNRSIAIENVIIEINATVRAKV